MECVEKEDFAQWENKVMCIPGLYSSKRANFCDIICQKYLLGFAFLWLLQKQYVKYLHVL